MRKTHRGMKTEHAGAKQGGSGFYGHHEDAKVECKVARRHNDKVEIDEQMTSFCGSDNDENDYEIGYREGAAVVFGMIGMAHAIRGKVMVEFINELLAISRAKRKVDA